MDQLLMRSLHALWWFLTWLLVALSVLFPICKTWHTCWHHHSSHFGSRKTCYFCGYSWEPTFQVLNQINFGQNALNSMKKVWEPEWNQFHLGEKGVIQCLNWASNKSMHTLVTYNCIHVTFYSYSNICRIICRLDWYLCHVFLCILMTIDDFTSAFCFGSSVFLVCISSPSL